MTEASTLRPADAVELIDTLAYALRYDGKKRVHHADDVMPRITAEYLIRHLALLCQKLHKIQCYQ